MWPGLDIRCREQVQGVLDQLETHGVAGRDPVTPIQRRLDRDQQRVADADPVFDPVAAIFEVFDDAARAREALGISKPHRFRPDEDQHVAPAGFAPRQAGTGGRRLPRCARPFA